MEGQGSSFCSSIKLAAVSCIWMIAFLANVPVTLIIMCLVRKFAGQEPTLRNHLYSLRLINFVWKHVLYTFLLLRPLSPLPFALYRHYRRVLYHICVYSYCAFSCLCGSSNWIFFIILLILPSHLCPQKPQRYSFNDATGGG